MKNIIILIVLTIISSVSKSRELEVATFSGGCFWCMEEAFESLEGVEDVISGYQGGKTVNPTYKDVSSGKTRHFESVQVRYDSSVVSYSQLLQRFWINIDPTNENGQFCDEGTQYRSGIFFHNDEQKRLIEQSILFLREQLQFQGEIKTIIQPVGPFYKAESKLQDYYKRHPWVYKFYKFTCGRSQRLEEIWDAH